MSLTSYCYLSVFQSKYDKFGGRTKLIFIYKLAPSQISEKMKLLKFVKCLSSL